MLFHSSTLYSKGNITLDSLISHMVRIRIMGMLSRTITLLALFQRILSKESYSRKV